jgi:hypothetical protein
MVGVRLVPSDFLEQDRELRRISCDHDNSSVDKFCNECGQNLQKIDRKVVLREPYRDKLTAPSTQYCLIDAPHLLDWLEFEVIRSNYDVDTAQISEGDDKCVIAGQTVATNRPNQMDLASVDFGTLKKGREATESMSEDLDLDMTHDPKLHLL